VAASRLPAVRRRYASVRNAWVSWRRDFNSEKILCLSWLETCSSIAVDMVAVRMRCVTIVVMCHVTMTRSHLRACVALDSHVRKCCYELGFKESHQAHRFALSPPNYFGSGRYRLRTASRLQKSLWKMPSMRVQQTLARVILLHRHTLYLRATAEVRFKE
jgi:hypothetical protein